MTETGLSPAARTRAILLLEKERRDCERSLAAFIRSAWHVLEPETPLLWNWHLDAVCEHFQALDLGQIRRLIVNVPPRSLKSITASVCYPAWVWTRAPHRRFMGASYAQSLATKLSVDCRLLVESPWYQMHWGHLFQLKDDANQKMEFENDRRGHRIATSVNGVATGKGCSDLIVDDPHDTKRAESDKERESAIESFRLKLTTRLDDKKTGRIAVIMQRLHHRDLTAVLVEQGDYTQLTLPAECETRTVIPFPISGREYVREPGSLLHPDRLGPEELATEKRALGSYGYAGQYQQTPTQRSGGIIKREWIQWYKTPPSRWDQKIIVADLTYEEGEDNDYTVVECWGRSGGDIYLLDQFRAQCGISAQIRMIKAMRAKHPDAFRISVEKKANGAALIEMVSREITGVVPYNPHTGKVVRLEAVEPAYEARQVYYPDPSIAPWVAVNEQELMAFPKGAHDDTCDTASMAISQLMTGAAALQRLKALTGP